MATTKTAIVKKAAKNLDKLVGSKSWAYDVKIKQLFKGAAATEQYDQCIMQLAVPAGTEVHVPEGTPYPEDYKDTYGFDLADFVANSSFNGADSPFWIEFTLPKKWREYGKDIPANIEGLHKWLPMPTDAEKAKYAEYKKARQQAEADLRELWAVEVRKRRGKSGTRSRSRQK